MTPVGTETRARSTQCAGGEPPSPAHLQPTSSPSLAPLLPPVPGGGVWEGRGWLAGLSGRAGWDPHQLRQVRALVSGPAGLSRSVFCPGPPSSPQHPAPLPPPLLPGSRDPLPLAHAQPHWHPPVHSSGASLPPSIAAPSPPPPAFSLCRSCSLWQRTQVASLACLRPGLPCQPLPPHPPSAQCSHRLIPPPSPISWSPCLSLSLSFIHSINTNRVPIRCKNAGHLPLSTKSEHRVSVCDGRPISSLGELRPVGEADRKSPNPGRGIKYCGEVSRSRGTSPCPRWGWGGGGSVV